MANNQILNPFKFLPKTCRRKMIVNIHLGVIGIWSGLTGLAISSQTAFHPKLTAYASKQAIADKAIEGSNVDFERGIQQLHDNQYQSAIEILQRALQQQREAEDYLGEIHTLINIGIAQYRLSNFQDALLTFATALKTIQTQVHSAESPSKVSLESRVLGEIGHTHHRLGNYSTALEYYQQALTVLREKGNISELSQKEREVQALVLNYFSETLRRQGYYADALAKTESALTIAQDLNQPILHGIVTENLGVIHDLLSQYNEAIQRYEIALRNVQDAGGDPYVEARILHSIGINHLNRSQYSKALENFQESLSLTQSIGDRAGEARAIGSIGLVSHEQGNYLHAIEQYKQALAIHQSVGDRYRQSEELHNLGATYWTLGDYNQAIELLREALQIQQTIGAHPSSGSVFLSLGTVYHSQGQYAVAQAYLEKAIAIFSEIGGRAGEGTALNSIAGVHYSLGELELARTVYLQALEIRQAIGDRSGTAVSLNNIGLIYSRLKQPAEALDYFQQSLAMYRAIGNRVGIANALGNIGLVYQQQDNYSQALNALERALSIQQDIGNLSGEATTLNNIALVYELQLQYSEAFDTYQVALAIFQDIGDRAGEQLTLSNIGYLLEQQGEVELAIVFYKKAVGVIEKIRLELQEFSVDQQQTYTETVAETYRHLANLLLSQGRVVEAQKVLELLKVEELREFTRDSRNLHSDDDIILNVIETTILEEFNTLVAFGKQVYECEQTNCDKLSSYRQGRRAQANLFDTQANIFIQTIRDNRQNDDFFYDPRYLNETARDIVAQPGTLLIYPFVTEDKLWLLYSAKGDVAGAVPVNVSQLELGKKVVDFRNLLESPDSDLTSLKITGKKLYDWLIAPLESEIQENNITNLVFSQDRVTRYIPMGALWDAKQYLTQKYTIYTILSAELTDMEDRLPPSPSETSVLAMGLADSVLDFNPLPHVTSELDAVVKVDEADLKGIYPGVQLLNDDFNQDKLTNNLFGHRIIHIATHGKFIASQPEASFLLLGDGQKFSISNINSLGTDLRDVHLVVLSACETAVGGPGADGIEVAGISSYFLAANRASAVLASLWLVNDASTSLLMQQFYKNLSQGTLTKSEALRKAQLSLLNGEVSPTSLTAFPRSIVEWGTQTGDAEYGINDLIPDLSHPYYWAPFILIGNGL